MSNISTLFAGRIAEEMMFGEAAVTTGASNDIERATDIARRMVTRWGMSKRLPPMQFDQDSERSMFLGGGTTQTMPLSDKTTLIIDEEVSKIINSCYEKAEKLLQENKDILEAMKEALLKYETLDAEQIDEYLNRRSGVLGISGLSSDFRDLESAAHRGDERSQLAIDVFAYRVKKYIGAYTAAMGGVDAIVFTAGLGENSSSMREKICEGLEYLGTGIDHVKNKARGKNQEINVDGAKVKIFAIPTNEELVIARDTVNICRRIIKL